MSSSASAIAGRKATRRFRTRGERRRIVEETLSAGVSVATVARSHGVNANLVFHWRKLYHAGLLDQPGTDATNDVRLLSVVSMTSLRHMNRLGPHRRKRRRLRWHPWQCLQRQRFISSFLVTHLSAWLADRKSV